MEVIKRVIHTLVWTLTLIGSIAGVLVLYFGFDTQAADSAIAVFTTIAVSCAVIPYCFARAVSMLMKK